MKSFALPLRNAIEVIKYLSRNLLEGDKKFKNIKSRIPGEGRGCSPKSV
jgi:hypothetical protein